MPRPNLVIATPGMGAMVPYRFMQALFRLIFYCNSHAIPVALEMITHDPIIPRARNSLTARFLDRPQATHILFLGPDARFSVRQILFMLSRNTDVIAGPAPKAPAPHSATMDTIPADAAPLRGDPLSAPEPPAPPLREVRCASLDFMLIRRRVFPRLFAAYPELRYGHALEDSSGYASPHLYGLFDSFIDPDSRHYLSGADAFCARWRKTGGKIFQTGQLPTPHH